MTRGSTSKRSSRQLKPKETSTPRRTLDSSPRPRTSRQDRYCFQDGHCLTSPKRPRTPSKPGYQGDAGHRPYWGELPKSPVQPSQSVPAGRVGERLHKIDSSQAGQSTVKRCPAETTLPNTLYSVFPKSSAEQATGRLGDPTSPKHSGLGTKSQRQKTPFPTTAASESSPTEVPPTLAPSETHASVGTVQELLPSQHQFQATGLAVTSLDQKAARESRRHLQSQGSQEGGGRLRFNQSKAFTQGDISPREDFSMDTAIHCPTSDDVNTLNKQIRTAAKDLKTLASLRAQKNYSQSSTALREPVPFPAAKRRVVKLRPLPDFLANKPLPAAPRSKADGTVTSISRTEKGHLQRDTTGGQEDPGLNYLSLAEMALPTLPSRRVPPQVRHPMFLPAKSSWVVSARQLPAAVAENESSPEQGDMPGKTLNGHSRSDTAIDTEPQTKESYPSPKNGTVIKLRIVSKSDIPETWRPGTKTPSRPKKALDDTGRKLGSPGDERRQTQTEHHGKSGTMSPSQRLQRAAAIRRQRIAEGAIQEMPKSEPPTPQSDSTITPLHVASKPGGSSQAEDQCVSTPGREVQPLFPEDDRDIDDRDVLRGLRIVCAASADAEFDAMVRTKTGLRLRRFLADLQSLEGLTEVGIAS